MQQAMARKNLQRTKFKAAEMILGSWNQQYNFLTSPFHERNSIPLLIHSDMAPNASGNAQMDHDNLLVCI